MGIILVTGVPGSGKSYFAASMMKEVYDKKNRLILTNVNLRIKYDDYIKPLDVQKLYKFARDEMALFEKFNRISSKYKEQLEEIEIIDDESKNNHPDFPYLGNYDKYLKDSGLLDYFGGSYIVWDECQNDLQPDGLRATDPVWVRFFSYHRHFDMDIVLITQDVSLIPRKYRSFISKFYFGQNPSKRLTSKTLRFKVYTDSRQFEKYYIETISIPMKKEIFEFYDSGEYKVEKSALMKKIALPILLIMGIFAAYKLFFSPKPENIQQNPIALENNQSHSNDVEVDNEDEQMSIYDDEKHLLFFFCNLKICTLKNSSFVVPFESFKNYTDSMEAQILYVTKITNRMSEIAVYVKRNVYQDLMRFSFDDKQKYKRSGNVKESFSTDLPKF